MSPPAQREAPVFGQGGGTFSLRVRLRSPGDGAARYPYVLFDCSYLKMTLRKKLAEIRTLRQRNDISRDWTGKAPTSRRFESMKAKEYGRRERVELAKHIVAAPEICHGKPTFIGTRVMVFELLEHGSRLVIFRKPDCSSLFSQISHYRHTFGNWCRSRRDCHSCPGNC